MQAVKLASVLECGYRLPYEAASIACWGRRLYSPPVTVAPSSFTALAE